MYQQPREERTAVNGLCVGNCYCYDRCVWTQLNREYLAPGQAKPALWKRECNKSGFLYLSLVLLVGSQALFMALNEPYLRAEIVAAGKSTTTSTSTVSILPWIPLIVTEFFFVYALLCLLATACIDPGIFLPASLLETHLIEYERRLQEKQTGQTIAVANQTREVVIHGHRMRLKYCYTCGFFRPPRATHCSICNTCVDHFDHHCPWIGNCVGRRNYRTFYCFLIFVSGYLITLASCSLAHLILLARGSTFRAVLSKAPVIFVLLLLLLVCIWSVVGLTGFHTYLLIAGITTNEDIKGTFVAKTPEDTRYEYAENPFTTGSVWSNCTRTMCSARFPSRIRTL